jgi:hypothetical protein
MRTIHYSDWASQPDVHYACHLWTTPAWRERDTTLPEHVYEGQEGGLYTFEESLYNCEACKAAVEAAPLLRRERDQIPDLRNRVPSCRSCLDQAIAHRERESKL